MDKKSPNLLESLDAQIEQADLKLSIKAFLESTESEQQLWSQVVRLVHHVFGGNSNGIQSIADWIGVMMSALDLMDDFQDGDSHLGVTSAEVEPQNSYTIILTLITLSFRRLHQLTATAPEFMDRGFECILGALQGQHLDINPVQHHESEYFEMIRKKSGSLVWLATLFGTFDTSCSQADRDTLRDIANLSGMYQQLVNDLSDLLRWDQKNDLITRKKTFPIHFLLEQSATNPTLKSLSMYYQGEIDFFRLSQEKNQLLVAIRNSNVMEATKIILENLRQQADLQFLQLSHHTSQEKILSLKRLLFPNFHDMI